MDVKKFQVINFLPSNLTPYSECVIKSRTDFGLEIEIVKENGPKVRSGYFIALEKSKYVVEEREGTIIWVKLIE